MEKYYSLYEVAELLSVSIHTVRSWVNRDKIKSVKVMGNRRIPESELKRLIKKE